MASSEVPGREDEAESALRQKIVANRRWKANSYALHWRRGELLVPGDFAGRAQGAWWGPMKGIALVLEALVVVVYCSKWKLLDSFSDPRCSYRSTYLPFRFLQRCAVRKA
jgi:hypothetical protein